MATKLLCIGDVAISGEMPGASPWPCPEGFEPGPEHQILFNWEFPFGQKNDKPRQRGQRFVACADALQVIRDWAPGIATLATNHALDAGSEGLFETREKFHQKAFLTVGAGTAPEEINAPIFWETSQGTVAILNWVFAETHPDWMAIPGPNCWPGIKAAGRQIAVARSRSDWVLVIVHWSDELFAHPLPGDRTTAFALAEAGADMIIGHHPHVVRGMEQFGNCPVLYSLGNFYFSEIRDVSGKWVSQEAPRTRE